MHLSQHSARPKPHQPQGRHSSWPTTSQTTSPEPMRRATVRTDSGSSGGGFARPGPGASDHCTPRPRYFGVNALHWHASRGCIVDRRSGTAGPLMLGSSPAQALRWRAAPAAVTRTGDQAYHITSMPGPSGAHGAGHAAHAPQWQRLRRRPGTADSHAGAQPGRLRRRCSGVRPSGAVCAGARFARALPCATDSFMIAWRRQVRAHHGTRVVHSRLWPPLFEARMFGGVTYFPVEHHSTASRAKEPCSHLPRLLWRISRLRSHGATVLHA